MNYEDALRKVMAVACCSNSDYGCDYCPNTNGDENCETVSNHKIKEALEILKNEVKPTDYITTEEFIAEAKKMGYTIKCGSTDALLFVMSGKYVAVIVSTEEMHKISTMQSVKIDEDFYDLLDRYARTPLDKRVVAKRFRAYIEGIASEEHKWLNEFTPCRDLQFGSAKNVRDFKTIFTAEELVKHEKTLGFTLERVEVE